MRETIRKNGSRQPDFARQSLYAPVVRRPAVDQFEGMANLRMPEPRKPATRIHRQPVDVLADDFDEKKFGQFCQDNFAASIMPGRFRNQ